jgi:regulator of sigma E protease
MITSPAIEGGDKPDAEPLPPAAPLSKILVAVAGPAMNVVFAFLVATIIYFTGLPVAVNPAIIGHVDADSEEYALGLRDGDRIVEVAGKPVESWEDVNAIVMVSRLDTLPVVLERAGQRTPYELKAAINPIIDLKMLNLDPQDHPVVREVMKDSAAEEVGLKPGDTVLEFAQVPSRGASSSSSSSSSGRISPRNS